jgi:hypothetical protein
LGKTRDNPFTKPEKKHILHLPRRRGPPEDVSGRKLKFNSLSKRC